MLIQLTVGKVDAGVAVLLTQDKRLIEFPSILLPASITSGSIVDITVAQNNEAEKKSQAGFADLQSRILDTYGLSSPSSPSLRLRGATQTSLVLEWDALDLATSKLKSLSLYRNGSRAGSIPRPLEILSTKISGLALDTEYSFHLVLRTTGGTYSSPVLTCRTHKMTDLSGITVTPGTLAEPLRASLQTAVERIGGRIADTVRIDTTQFVCTEGRGKEWERAVEMNIPVVRPEWIEGCEREGRIVGVTSYYLDANPKHRQVGSNPSISPNPAAGPSGAAAAAAGPSGTHSHPPQRTTPRPTTTSDNDRHITGEGNGPGPEEPPTPPPKSQVPMRGRPDAEDTEPVSPASGSSASVAPDAVDISEPENDVTKRSSAGPQRAGASMKAKVKDENEDDEDDDEEEEEEKKQNGKNPDDRGQMDNIPL